MHLLPILLAPLLLQHPTLSETSIAFSWGGYLWTVDREGGAARQITTGGHESDPVFSPDGSFIAFTGQYDGNVDVYAVPAGGGSPKRLTWHPSPDEAVSWTRDGKGVVFRSTRDAHADFSRLFTVPLDGGFPDELPMWRAQEGSFSPDGTHMAYVPNMQWQKAWKRYRGGQTTSVQIVRLEDLDRKMVPRENSNDSNPMWIGDTVYFLSDRNGPTGLFAYDVESGSVREFVKSSGLDLKSASGGPGAIVYEEFGSIHLLDLASGESREVPIQVAGDIPASRPRFEKVADEIQVGALSPSGVRIAFEAHGEILTAPAEKGDIRNLTSSPGAAERDPAWSPDGQSIAYFSDESGEYQLHIRGQSGLGEIRKIALGDPPSYFYSPLWSPDGKKIAFT
ncbi:MAG: S41 family peptidase, partial [Vicinamibacteria bacterium]